MTSGRQSLRLILSLGLAGLLAGSVLAGVHVLTRPAIERHRADALERAIYSVLPGTTEIRPWLLDEQGLTAPDPGVPGPGAAEAAGRPVWEGLGPDGTRRGFAVVAEGPGFQDTIRLLYGLDVGRRVITGVVILESRETPGLGDRILHDEAFHRSFEALAIEPSIEVVMGTPTRPNQIDGITGATISSQAVADILDASARQVLEQLVAAESSPEDPT